MKKFIGAGISVTLAFSLSLIVIDAVPSVGGIQERAVFPADYVLISTATESLSSNGERFVRLRIRGKFATYNKKTPLGWESFYCLCRGERI